MKISPLSIGMAALLVGIAVAGCVTPRQGDTREYPLPSLPEGLAEGIWVSHGLETVDGRAEDRVIRFFKENDRYMITTALVWHPGRNQEPVVKSVSRPAPVQIGRGIIEFEEDGRLIRQTIRFDGRQLVTPALLRLNPTMWFMAYTDSPGLRDLRAHNRGLSKPQELFLVFDSDPTQQAEGSMHMILRYDPLRLPSYGGKTLYRSSLYRGSPDDPGWRRIQLYGRSSDGQELSGPRFEFRPWGLDIAGNRWSGANQFRYNPFETLPERDRAFFLGVFSRGASESNP